MVIEALVKEETNEFNILRRGDNRVIKKDIYESLYIIFALNLDSVNDVTLSCLRKNVQKTINRADSNSNQIYATHPGLKGQLFLVYCNYVSWQRLLATLCFIT